MTRWRGSPHRARPGAREMAISLGGGNEKGVTPQMNVTPLVDVVLVLLIIFMVVAPRLDQDIAVELPGIFNPRQYRARFKPLKYDNRRAKEGLAWQCQPIFETGCDIT